MKSKPHQPVDKSYCDDAFRLHYQITGEGECLVLLHGYLDNAIFWSDFITGINCQYRTIAIDLPGHGESLYLKEHITIENLADSIKSLLKIENITSAIFIGHSMGGYVALAISVRHPQLVHKLILVHSHPFTDDAIRAKSRKREIEFIKKGKFDLIKKALLLNRFNDSFLLEHPLKLRLVETTIDAMIPKNAEQTLIILLSRPDYSKNLLTSTIPTLFCLSPTDKHVDIMQITDKYSNSKHIRMALFESSLHMCHWEEPELFFVTVMGFVQQIEE